MPERVLVLESSPEVAFVMEQTLSDEGYEVPVVVDAPDAVAEVRTHAPDAVALDLPADAGKAGLVLDALRVDPATRSVPLLATSCADAVADAAAASYTVESTLRKPFDLEDLVARVERTLQQPPLQHLVPGEPAQPVLGSAESVVAAGSRAMLLQWVQRLRMETQWGERPDASVGDMLCGAPTIVDAMGASLRLPEPETMLDEHPAAADRLLATAQERSVLGIERPEYLREVALLREELWNMLSRELPPGAAPEDLRTVRQAVDASLDRILQLTAPVFNGPTSADPAISH